MSIEPTRTIPLPGGPSDRVPLLRLSVTAGPDAGRELVATTTRAVVGRAPAADLVLTDDTVSLLHLELTSGPNDVGVRDLDSRNGTYASDVAVSIGRVPFGASIRIGTTTLVVDRMGDQIAPRSKAMSFGGLVGASPAMRDVYTLLERLAATDLSVLVEGETGTGKDLAARSLHEKSARANGPFVTLDCTTIPPGLAESVLFGHERGAFTGATERQIGMIESADGGTLFLDELGELPLELQPKLLRVLERREVVTVGGTKPRAVDVRLVCATWRDLTAMADRGEFREDLYFRIAQARVRMPSLAERPDDKRPLILHFLAGIPPHVKAARAIAPDALEALAGRPFAGNVRELKSCVERLAMMAEGASISLDDVSFDRVVEHDRGAPGALPSPTISPDGELVPFKEAKRTLIDDFERSYLAKLMARSGKSVSRAAALAKIERQTFRDLLRRHGVQFDDV